MLISPVQQNDSFIHIYICIHIYIHTHTHILFYILLHYGLLMAPHSSTLAWKIPWTEEPGGLWFMGSLRVGHNWATSLSLFIFMHWRRKWQPTPVFLPGESQGQRCLVGCRLWGRTESDTTEATQQQQQEQHRTYSFLCYTVGPWCLPILYRTVCTWWWWFSR